MTTRQLLLMISALGSSLLWAEEKPAVASEAVSAPSSAVEEAGKVTPLVAVEVPQERDGKEPKKDRPGGGHHGRRGQFWKDMNDSQRERLLYYHHLIIRKYDLNRNGVLEPEEMEALKKDSRRFREERRQFILKKFDKNGDGKLDEEERKAMREALKADIEKRLKERKEGKADDGELPPLPPERSGREGRPGATEPGDMDRKKQEEQPKAAEERKEGPEDGHGKARAKDGHQRGKRGHERGRGWGPEGMIMSLGYHLMMEKFDKDKDGKLSQEERKAYEEDRQKFGRWLNAMRKKLKDQGRLEEVEKNPPPIMAPPPEKRKENPPESGDKKE